MKKFVSLLMCCVFAISAFAVFPQADEAITKSEAAELIVKMERFHRSLAHLMTDSSEGIVIWQLECTEVEDEELYNRLLQASRYNEDPELFFYLLDGEYGKLSFWHEYMGEFLTEDYIQKNIEFNFAIIQLDDKVYCVDGVFYAIAPGFPVLINEGQQKDIFAATEDHIKIVDNDTVLLDARYSGDSGIEDRFQSRGWLEVDFEYTENGWRISGGKATEDFTRLCSLRDNTANPDTSDNGIVIVVCATVALVGIALTANKRRFAR